MTAAIAFLITLTIRIPDTFWKNRTSEYRTIWISDTKKSGFQMNPDFGCPVFGWLLYKYSGGLNTKHWNTERFKIRFSNGPKTRWLPFCLVFQWSRPLEKELLASIDFSIDKHNFCLYIKQFRLLKSWVFQWSRLFQIQWWPFCQPLKKPNSIGKRTDPNHWNCERVWYSSPHCMSKMLKLLKY